jgi:hypothetical protein
VRKCYNFYCKNIQEDLFKETIVYVYTQALK